LFSILCVFLRVKDIAIIRVGSRALDQAENKVETVKIEDFSKNLENFKNNKKWVIFAYQDTSISVNYILSILNEYSQRETVVGRIGCVPNSIVSSKRKTKTCMKYPILKSGFAVTSDLLKNLEFFNENKTELDFGVLLQNAEFADDYRFHYFGADHKTRGEKFAATFFPLQSANIKDEFLHAAGLSIDIMFTNKAKGKVKLGVGYEFYGESVEAPENINMNIECANVSFIQPPQQVFTRNANVQINCF
jgi:hypothetical protein